MQAGSSACVIVGGGLAGASLAAQLAQDGHKVKVFEARKDCRSNEQYEGRSINLALSERGLAALRNIGIEEQVKAICVPMYNRAMHDHSGKITYQAYGHPGQCNYSVPRKELNEILLDAAEAAGASVFFEHKLVDLDVRDPSTPATFADASGARTVVENGCVIGADGAFSAVRSRLQRTARFNHSQTYIGHGYKELCIPPGPGGVHVIDPGALHIWPRHEYMVIALPNADGSFTVTLFLPYGDPEAGVFGFRDLDSDDKVLAFFKAEFPDLIPLLPNLLEEFNANPLGSLMYVRCEPWNFGDRVLLIGDAASAIVPFHGQGMNSSLQQTFDLANMIKESGSIHDVIPKFSKIWKPNADAISDLALQNYIEMRDHTASAVFLARARLELIVNKLFPSLFAPRYGMVTFSTIPYAEVVSRSKRQHAGLDIAIAVSTAAFMGGAMMALRRFLSSK